MAGVSAEGFGGATDDEPGAEGRKTRFRTLGLPFDEEFRNCRRKGLRFDEEFRTVLPKSSTDGERPAAMRKNKSPRKPTEAEFNILGAIWERNSATVREIHDQLSERQDIGYTTVLKLMQIMIEKGLLERDTSVRPQVYWAARPQRQTQRMLLRDLLDRAFKGSPGSLVLQALSMRKTSPEELREIRALLDRLQEQDS